MRKFAFLLAIVAVFAMSVSAFAAAGDLRQALTVETTDTPDDQNNGAIANGATKVYYYGTLGASDKYQINAKFKSAAGDGIATTDKIGGFIGGTTWMDLAGAAATLAASTAVNGDGNFTDVDNDVTSITGIAVYEGTTDPSTAAAQGATLTITPTAVKFPTAAITQGKSKDQTIELRFFKGVEIEEDVVIDVVPTDLAAATFGSALEVFNGSADVSAPLDGITFTATMTGVKIAKTSKPTAKGTYTLTLKTSSSESELKVKETAAGEDIVVAVASTGDPLKEQTVATITVVVELPQTNEASFLPEEKTSVTLIDEEIASALVISTDISTDVIAEAKSTDLKLYIDDVDLTKSCDIAMADGGYTFTIPVATLADLGLLSSVPVYVTDDTAVMTNKLSLTITQKTGPVYPPVPVEQLGTKDTAALNAIGVPYTQAGSAMSYSEGVVSSDDRYLADGMRISETCAVGEAVAFGAGQDFYVGDPDETRGFQLVKRFVAGDTKSDVPLSRFVKYDAETGAYTLNAVVAIINDAYSEAKYGKADHVYGANGQYAVKFVNGDANKSNVILICDGVADANASDPIGLKAVGWHSSSSSCSMGFGLVAVAGLAALALRKRSK